MLQMFITILTAGWYRPACPVQLKQPLLLFWSVASATDRATDRQHRWLDIAITNMYAGAVQVYQKCMLVDISLQNDMTAG